MSVHDTAISDLVTAFDRPLDLLELSYQNRLRVTGRFLDGHRLHTATVIEVQNGFVLRASRSNEPWPQVVELSDRQLANMLRESIQARGESEPIPEIRDLIPTGYEDLFRAIGYELDQRVAESIVLSELPSFLALSGYEPVFGLGEPTYQQFSDAIGAEEVALILQRAVSRRGTHQHIQQYIPPNFRG